MIFSAAVRHRFQGFDLDVAFEAPSGITMLFGPSGAGKSTVMAAISGLLQPDSCRVVVGGRVLADTTGKIWTPAERRRIGVVFQDLRLFPHMSVATNLHYGQRRARGGEIGFDDVVALLGIGALLDRRPRDLSGGERARVAIGRALLSQPSLLLMDEPLASLDAARKAEIMPYLLRLKTALQLPILYVTHAMEEVVQLADHLVLLEAGRVVASGALAEIAARGDSPLGLRDDAGAVIAATVVAHDVARQLTSLDGLASPMLVPLLNSPPGTAVRVRIPAREVILARERPASISVQNVIPGVVRAITHDAMRHADLVEVMAGDQAVLARVTPDAAERLGLAAGVAVFVLFKSVGIDARLRAAR